MRRQVIKEKCYRALLLKCSFTEIVRTKTFILLSSRLYCNFVYAWHVFEKGRREILVMKTTWHDWRELLRIFFPLVWTTLVFLVEKQINERKFIQIIHSKKQDVDEFWHLINKTFYMAFFVKKNFDLNKNIHSRR